MIRCQVIGKIWATQKRPELQPYSLMLLKSLGDEKKEKNLLVAANAIHAKEGEIVFVAVGSGARNALGNQELPIEAAIVAIEDQEVEE